MADNQNIIKFGKAKKAIARSRKQAQAAENRVKFGRTKAQKRADDHQNAKTRKTVEDHKIEASDPAASPERD